MAQLHGNGLSEPRDHNLRIPHAEGWIAPESEDREPNKLIEVRGSVYIAFCKAWAPAWVDDEADFD